MIKALIYNEWRQQRAAILWIFFSQMLLWLGVQLCLGVNTHAMLNLALLLFILECNCPLIYVFVVSNTYGDEFKKGTINILLGNPVSPSAIFWSKFFFSYCIMLGLTLSSIIIGYFYEPFLFRGTPPTMMPHFSYLFPIWYLLLFFGVPYVLVTNSDRRFHLFLFVNFLLLMASVSMLWVVTSAVLAAVDMENCTGMIPAALYLIAVILAPLMLVESWWLWTRYVTRGLSIRVQLLRHSGVLLLFAVLSYSVVEIWAKWEWHHAVTTAASWRIALPPENDRLNVAAPLLQEMANSWNRVSSHLSLNLKAGLPLQPNFTSEQWTKFSADLASPLLKSTAAWLQQALSVPPDAPITAYRYPYALFSYANSARNYLVCRGWAAAYNRQEKELFHTIEELQQLGDLVLAVSRMEKLDCVERACSLALYCGPDSATAAAFYRTLIVRLDQLDYWSDYRDGSFGQFMEVKSFKSFLEPYLLLRKTVQIRHQIERRQLAASSRYYRGIADEAQKLEVRYSINNPKMKYIAGDDPIYSYYLVKTQFDVYRLALALRVYYIEHGEFPNVLAALSPKLLPVIPEVAINGRKYNYRLQKRGFVLSCDIEPNSLKTRCFQVSYQPFHEAIK